MGNTFRQYRTHAGFHEVSATRGTSTETYHVQRRPSSVVGVPSADDIEWLCQGGHWAKRKNRKNPDVLYYAFHSSRAADEHVRRLNNGIPINYELWLVGAGAIIAVANLRSDAYVEAMREA